MPKTIIIRPIETWDGEHFGMSKEHKITIEHSLISISKWEAIWHKPFLASAETLTDEEMLSYIRCMTTNQSVPEEAYRCLSQDNVDEIASYIANPMTASTVRDNGTSDGSSELVTSELIYYWMIANGIPVEFEKWHLNRLIMLIRICSIKNNPDKKKVSEKDTIARYKALNEARKKKWNTKG